MHCFFRWAVTSGHLSTSPIPQVAARPGLGSALSARTVDEQRPATYAYSHNRGKIERFNRTLAQEWAYSRQYSGEQARRKALPGWLHHSITASTPPSEATHRSVG